QDAVKGAADFKARHGVPAYVPDVVLADILRKHSLEMGAAQHPAAPAPVEEQAPVFRKKQGLRSVIQRKVGKLALMTGEEPKTINIRLKQIVGVSPNESSIPQLLERVAILDQWIEASYDG